MHGNGPFAIIIRYSTSSAIIIDNYTSSMEHTLSACPSRKSPKMDNANPGDFVPVAAPKADSAEQPVPEIERLSAPVRDTTEWKHGFWQTSHDEDEENLGISSLYKLIEDEAS